MRGEHSEHVGAPLERVFEVFADIEHAAQLLALFAIATSVQGGPDAHLLVREAELSGVDMSAFVRRAGARTARSR